MDSFIIKKLKLDDDNKSSVAGTSSGSITHTTVSASSKPSRVNMINPSNSFHLKKSSHVLRVVSVVRNWQTKLSFQVS
jgi:hypothetical protein